VPGKGAGGLAREAGKTSRIMRKKSGRKRGQPSQEARIFKSHRTARGRREKPENREKERRTRPGQEERKLPHVHEERIWTRGGEPGGGKRSGSALAGRLGKRSSGSCRGNPVSARGKLILAGKEPRSMGSGRLLESETHQDTFEPDSKAPCPQRGDTRIPAISSASRR